MKLISFEKATQEGEIINKEGYHKPNGSPYLAPCGCKKTTPKGAYRDVSVEMDNGTIVHFYHQTPVVVKQNGKYKLNNGGYKTSTTKERINRYLPSGFKLIQRDFEWYLESWNSDTDYKDREYETNEFKSGMEIEN